jgi:Domain of unknown function (DUF4258)
MKNIIFFLSLCGILAACEPLENGQPRNVSNNKEKRDIQIAEQSKQNAKYQEAMDKISEALEEAERLKKNKGNQGPSELSYKGKKLILTKHAKCRMGCRYIDESEIMEIIAENNINQRKSTTTAENGKCPTTAYEGVSRDDQELRIIVAYCEGDDVARVVTVIDTGNEFNCTCD